MPYSQGSIVIGNNPFSNDSKRPYLIISNKRHPFMGEEYLGVVVTTTNREKAIPINDNNFRKGELPKSSYVSPWCIVTIKDDYIEKNIAIVDNYLIKETYRELLHYIDPIN
ncbi:MAG: PemK/MazF family toxin [Candidatus Methanohalarchaeum thermophilum]|uniref:PemK/MazF family toxin n=1 Tax=Methanohalarchaeum thermophilum TaxID=1903181 RepID=A0A1Q6DSI5_METT1|nr:MAG: PemK/MazF family toxin [Candidatus Methanohalarchaeum thermophilum]